MADDKELTDRIKEAGMGFAEGFLKDGSYMLKSIGLGMINDVVDSFSKNAKKSASSVIFPNGDAPKNPGQGSSSSSYRDYASYSRPRVERERDRIGTRSITDLELVAYRTEEEAWDTVREMIAKIDGSGHCRIGDLYEMARPKIAPATVEWKYGWLDQDKGLFDVKRVASGPSMGMYMVVVPKPHLL